MSVQSIDLGRITGLALFEEWSSRDENEGKTWYDFLAEMAAIGISIDTTDSVEEGNPAVVTSRGVWEKLATLGILDPGRIATPAEPSSLVLVIHSYQLGDELATEDGEDVSAWIDSATGTDGTWTLSPEIGQEWFVLNGEEENALVVNLPDNAPVGSVVRVHFLPTPGVSEVEVPTITAGGVIVFDMERPTNIGGVVLVAENGPLGWSVVFHYAEAQETVETKNAEIVYSGANRAGTASTIYRQPVLWTGTGDGSATLRNDIFRKLYNVAPFSGWATSSASSTSTYSDGATITVEDAQTVTLFPLYTATNKSASGGFSFRVNGTKIDDGLYCNDGSLTAAGAYNISGTIAHSVNGAGRGTNKFILTLNPKAVLNGFAESELWVVFKYGQTTTGTGITRTFSFSPVNGTGSASASITVPTTKGTVYTSSAIKFTGFNAGASKEWYVTTSGSELYINAGITVSSFSVR